MLTFDLKKVRVERFSGPADGYVELTLREGETGCDDDRVIAVDFELFDGAYHIGKWFVPRWLEEGDGRKQSVTIAARQCCRWEVVLLAKAFSQLAEWLIEDSSAFDPAYGCKQSTRF